MRSDHIKQIIAISESNAADFQQKMNEALSEVVNPEVIFDRSIPFTAYITYSVRKDVPETALELLELLDGSSHDCEECPYFIMNSDKRTRWGECSFKKKKTRINSTACEQFYLWRMKEVEKAKKLYSDIPYIAE